jgi:hydantoinase/carbamoylase family amidase
MSGMKDSDSFPSADSARMLENLQTLAQFGALPGGGVDRQTYSKPYREAIAWLSAEMEKAGLRVRTDPAGNLIGRLGPDGPALLCGSHIDSVPRGGTLDGTLGVLAGVECARCFKADAARMRLGFEVVAFADEEGSFVSLLGSRAMTGLLSQDEVDRAQSRNGLRLPPTLLDYGLDPATVIEARRSPDEIAGYIELHIEQGPVLEAEALQIGIVEAVVGISTGHHELIGQANHAGTTPIALRRDAMRTAAAAMTRCFDALTGGSHPSTVLNFGQLKLEPGATNVVPKRVTVTQEIRSTVLDRIHRFEGACEEIFAATAKSLNVEHVWHRGDVDPPAVMAKEVRARIQEACAALGFSAKTMPSGAGHDAQLFAAVCPTGMIFVPSRNGISHNPAEFTDPESLARGLQLLYATCRSWVMAG